MSAGMIELGHFCRIVQGGRLGLSGNHFVPEGYPAYGAGGMNGFLPTFEYDEPAIVLSAIGARCGKCFYAEGKWHSLANTQLIFPDPARADARFLWHQLNNERRWHRSGTGQPFIKPADVKTHRVFLPSLTKQQRIAAILDKADALRGKRRATLAKLDTLPQSIFLDMFGDPVTNPMGWLVKTVGEVAAVQGGLQVTSARKSLPSEVPYLRVANVYRGSLDLSEIKTIRATDAEIERALLVKNDLLIVEGHGNAAEIGRAALWDGSIPRCVHQNHLIRVRFERKSIEPLYGCQYLNSPGGRKHLLRAGRTTSGLNTISVSDVRATPIAVPPVAAQRRFVQKVAKVRCALELQRASLGRVDTLLRSLQYRAFRGEL